MSQKSVSFPLGKELDPGSSCFQNPASCSQFSLQMPSSLNEDILKESISPIKSKVSNIAKQKKSSHPPKFPWKHKFFELVQGLNLSVTVDSVSYGLERSDSRAQTWAFFPEHCAFRGRLVYHVPRCLMSFTILFLYFVLTCLIGQKFCILMNSSTCSIPEYLFDCFSALKFIILCIFPLFSLSLS